MDITANLCIVVAAILIGIRIGWLLRERQDQREWREYQDFLEEKRQEWSHRFLRL